MKTESIRDLRAFEELAANPHVTQRRLAQRLQVAVGLANLMIKRFAKKGHLEIVNLKKKNRIQYLLTPTGLAEKSRLSYEFLEYSLYLYRMVRNVLQENLSRVAEEGGKDIVFFGSGEVAEICYLTLKEMNLNLIGVIDDSKAGGSFFGVPILGLKDLGRLRFDGGIVSGLNHDASRLEELKSSGKLAGKIIFIEQRGPEVVGFFHQTDEKKSEAKHVGIPSR